LVSVENSVGKLTLMFTDIFSLKPSWCNHQHDKSDNPDLHRYAATDLFLFLCFVVFLFPWFTLRAVENSVDILLWSY
jgi:hypothetical protein